MGMVRLRSISEKIKFYMQTVKWLNKGEEKHLEEVKCMILEHYSIFIHRVREYNNTMKSLRRCN